MLSKEVQLPVNEATLTAYAIPSAEDYNYEWRLVEFTPRGAAAATPAATATASSDKHGSMKNSRSDQLELTGLEEGVYQVHFGAIRQQMKMLYVFMFFNLVQGDGDLQEWSRIWRGPG